MDRRTFLLITGVGALAAYTPEFLKSSDAETSTTGTAIAQASSYQVVGTLSQLDQATASIESRVGNTYLVVIRNAAGNLVAFNRRCPHEGCRVDWQVDQNKFVCPCHAAEFSAAGSVVRGPARSPLQTYPVRVEGSQVLVQV